MPRSGSPRIKTLFHRMLGALVLGLAAFTVPTVVGAEGSDPSRFQIPETHAGLPGVGPIRRYYGFRNLWAERRSAWARRVTQDQGALVFLGDSITQGWGDDFGGRFPGVKVANRGISGDTTRGMLLRLAEDVLVLNPAGVVLLLGTNDLEERAEPEQVVANLKFILAALHAHNSKLPVVLC